MNRLDVDDSGYISVENLKEILGDDFSPEKADEMIREADRKGDGRVDYQEFLALFRNESESLISPSKEAPVAQRPATEAEHSNKFVGPAVEEEGSIVLEGGPSMSGSSLPTISEGGGTPHVNGNREGNGDDDYTSSDEIEVEMQHSEESVNSPRTPILREQPPNKRKQHPYTPSPLRHGVKVQNDSKKPNDSESRGNDKLGTVPETKAVPYESPEKEPTPQSASNS